MGMRTPQFMTIQKEHIKNNIDKAARGSPPGVVCICCSSPELRRPAAGPDDLRSSRPENGRTVSGRCRNPSQELRNYHPGPFWVVWLTRRGLPGKSRPYWNRRYRKLLYIHNTPNLHAAKKRKSKSQSRQNWKRIDAKLPDLS